MSTPHIEAAAAGPDDGKGDRETARPQDFGSFMADLEQHLREPDVAVNDGSVIAEPAGADLVAELAPVAAEAAAPGIIANTAGSVATTAVVGHPPLTQPERRTPDAPVRGSRRKFLGWSAAALTAAAGGGTLAVLKLTGDKAGDNTAGQHTDAELGANLSPEMKQLMAKYPIEIGTGNRAVPAGNVNLDKVRSDHPDNLGFNLNLNDTLTNVPLLYTSSDRGYTATDISNTGLAVTASGASIPLGSDQADRFINAFTTTDGPDNHFRPTEYFSQISSVIAGQYAYLKELGPDVKVALMFYDDGDPNTGDPAIFAKTGASTFAQVRGRIYYRLVVLKPGDKWPNPAAAIPEEAGGTVSAFFVDTLAYGPNPSKIRATHIELTDRDGKQIF